MRLNKVAAAVHYGLKLRPYQQQAKTEIYDAWSKGYQNILYICPTGGGKCLGKDTPVLMYDGTIKMVQDVKTGDLLMGPDSTSRTVLSTCTGREMLYRITPVKGDPYIVNESHILSLKTTGDKHLEKGEVVNITVKDYLSRSNYFKHTHKGWRSSVDWQECQLPEKLPPYVLGLWLGDGSSYHAAITSADYEIVSYLYLWAESVGFKISEYDQKNNKSNIYNISGGLREQLKLYNLIQNKHIPYIYKINSREQRLQLLAGLMDSDGYLHNGYYEIVQKNERLTNDILFLARSLGFAAYMKPCKKKCHNNGVVGDYFRITISGDVSQIPTILNRHQPEPRRQKKDVLVTGIKVEPVGEGDYYGFEITGDRLFMLGDFTVTHNTVTLASIIHDHVGAACVIAHRQELVGQISKALAREGVYHNIIAPTKTVQLIRKDHINEVGADFIKPNSQVCVAGVQTLIRRKSNLESWMRQVTLWVIDEAHHVVCGNTWGNAVELFPHAKGLGVTATPIRADGHGLGREASGVFDTMVQGPTMRWLIDNGYLTDYKIYAPLSDINVDAVATAKDGDFNQKQLKKAARESHIIGDVVDNYIKFAMGKRGVTFVTDVETAKDVAAEYNSRGVPAEAVDANTPSDLRSAILKRFARGELLQLVNVDLFGEGFDLPAIEVCSFARPTMSYSLYVQQFGRALRIMDGKEYAIIIDHVGNVVRHGLPDRERVWSLDSNDKRPRVVDPDDEIPLHYCVACTRPYEKYLKTCPHCGWYEEPSERSRPEQVDGDLTELSAEVLAMMRGEVDRIEHETPQQAAQRVIDDLVAKHAPRVAILGHSKRAALKHELQQKAQSAIRESIAWWASMQQCTDDESYRKFFHLFGTDVLTAQSLPSDDMIKLAHNINNYITKKVNTHV